MPDIRLVPINSPDVITLDWLQTSTGLVEETHEFATAIIVAVCTDAQALPSDQLPDPRSDDLRGWWGDLDADTIWNGWPIGSKLWLLQRAAMTDQNARVGAIVTRVQNFVQAALQPFVTLKMASKITVDVQQTGAQTIIANVVVYRGPKSAIALQFQALWSQLAGAAA